MNVTQRRRLRDGKVLCQNGATKKGCSRRRTVVTTVFFRRDRKMPDGSTRSVFTRICLGKVGSIAELSARREHDRLRQIIDRERGSVPTAPQGETFAEVAKTQMKDVAPQLSPATKRQRESHLRAHLFPRFGEMALMAIDVPALQRFVTDLGACRKSTLNLLVTITAVLSYAKKCNIRVPEIPVGSITISGDRDGAEAVYFKLDEVRQIIQLAPEPYKTIFILAAVSALRAGELLGLTVGDIDFDRLLVCPRKQADEQRQFIPSFVTALRNLASEFMQFSTI